MKYSFGLVLFITVSSFACNLFSTNMFSVINAACEQYALGAVTNFIGIKIIIECLYQWKWFHIKFPQDPNRKLKKGDKPVTTTIDRVRKLADREKKPKEPKLEKEKTEKTEKIPVDTSIGKILSLSWLIKVI